MNPPVPVTRIRGRSIGDSGSGDVAKGRVRPERILSCSGIISRDAAERTLAIRVAGRAGVSARHPHQATVRIGYREDVATSTICAFVTRGLEDIAAAEISETSAVVGGIETRPKVVLTQVSDVRGLQRLRTVDDVAVVSTSSPPCTICRLCFRS